MSRLSRSCLHMLCDGQPIQVHDPAKSRVAVFGYAMFGQMRMMKRLKGPVPPIRPTRPAPALTDPRADRPASLALPSARALETVGAMAFTLRQLQFFVAAAEAGSVTGAARALSISQSSVTEAIRALEDDLGVTVFERQPKGLVITHRGSVFLRHARQILADVATARTAFRDDPEQVRGRLTLGVTSLVAGYVLSDILQRFRRAFPLIELNVIEDSGEYLQHLLIGGELDVAVLLTSSVRDRMALHVETLLVSPYRLWLPLGHPLALQESIGLEDLAGTPMIQLMVDEIEESMRRLTAALPVKPEIAFRTRSVEAVRSLVATGAGLAVLPGLVYRPWSLEGDRIEIRDVSGDLPSVQVGLAWRRGAPLSGPALNFVRSAQTGLAER
jgi:DNA-binding transcriptional LysR family regulator